MRIESAIAANRFGLGARPGELEKLDKDPKGALLRQLQGPSASSTYLTELPRSDKVLAEVLRAREAQRELKKKAGEKEAYFSDAIKPFRNAIGDAALAITGGIRSLNIMQGLIDEGVDMLGICRPLISEPNFPDKIFGSPEKNTARCTSCNKCLLRIATQPLKCVEFDKTDDE